MTRLRSTAINGRWDLLLPDHRAARPEWPWWEATRLAAMHHTITGMAAPVIFDVGAEEGDFPALWAKWGASVVLFEPNPLVWPNVKVIFEGNGLGVPRLCFVGFAADDTDWDHEALNALGEGSAGTWPSCASGPVIGDHGFQTIPEYPGTARVRIDDVVARTSIVPDVVTIDVEGAELRVLRGAAGVLAAHRPVVFVSIHPAFMADTYGDREGDLYELMGSLGYEDRFLCEDHERHVVFWHPDGAVTFP